ncbi:MAG: rhodanese-like domain-containing protein [Chitinophagia bacterium]|nr:rhodanese-like domain-containing protein [Chitinophagia bacterium]
MKGFLFSFLLVALVATGCTLGAKDKHTLQPKPYAQLLTEKKGALLLDVRTPEEFADGHLKQAQNIDFFGADFASRIGALDKNQPVFIYCKSGGRSGKALQQMTDMGFKEVYNLDGGISSWKGAGLEVEH